MPANRFNYLFVIVSILISAFLNACSDGENAMQDPVDQASNDQDNSNQLTLRAPPTIISVCAPDVLQLALTITMNGDSTTIAVPENGDGWTGIFPLQQGSNSNVELSWTHNGNVPLASLSTINSSQTIPFDEQGYTTVDTDNDGFSNIAELCSSPASDFDDIASIPAIQSTVDPVLSDLTPSRLELSANVPGLASGFFQFSNSSSGESILDYTVMSDQDFPILSQLSGKLVSGETQTITTDAVCAVEADSFIATITLTTNGGVATIPLSLNCELPESNLDMAVLSILTTQNLSISAETNETASGTISFMNTGDIPLRYSVSNNNTFFGVSPSGGNLPPGSTETLTITGTCGGNTVVLSDSFILVGNFSEVPPIEVSLDCGGSLPSVFTEENYSRPLISIFGIINNNFLSGGYTAYINLLSAVILDNPDPTILTEVSREESVDINGDPAFIIKYDCNAGGNVDVEQQGSQFDAVLFNCQIGPFILSGQLLDSGITDSPRELFSTFSGIIATFSGGSLTQSGSFKYSTDPTSSVYEYNDIQYTYEGGADNFAISNGFTSATTNVGVYQSEFEFDIIGSVTNNKNFKVKSDSVDTIRALEGFYYNQGNFTIVEVDGDGEMKIEPGESSGETFQLSISENASTIAVSVPWSDNYFFLCGIDFPTIEASTYLCRESD